MSEVDLEEAFARLAARTPVVEPFGLAARARAGSDRRRRWARTGVAAAVAVLLSATVGLARAAIVEREAPVRPAPAATAPAVELPPVPRDPLPLRGNPVRAARLVVGRTAGGTASTLVLGAHGEGYRVLPGALPLAEATRSGCLPSLSPDGTEVACVRQAGHVEVVALASGAVRSFTIAGGTRTPVWWSPDGKRFATLTGQGTSSVGGKTVLNARGDLVIVDLRGGTSRFRLAHAGSALAWSPDGKRIAVAFGGTVQGLAIYDARSAAAEQVLPFETYRSARQRGHASLFADSGVLFTADGRDLQVVSYSGGDGKPPYSLVTLDSSGRVVGGARLQNVREGGPPLLLGRDGQAVLAQSVGTLVVPPQVILVDPTTGRSSPLVVGSSTVAPATPVSSASKVSGAWRYGGNPIAVPR
ncbi:WD40 repeat protein [Motilibacter rhizosphaerae]|uniref:WD40 repeat protein n=1 Tax=Motilibacter rhizosphaerae TaxID=598652 RepID=A0A4V2F573_9ACTN|nr:PD40 domain-containing protein [Motilibacter rhizosphaerae]RZS91819.1 WD40 repeat protein [Motilibacter rhizosphaerae]